MSDPLAGLEDLGLAEDLVTGEAVVLELRPASFATRALALLLDAVILVAVSLLLGFLLPVVLINADEATGTAIGVLTMALLYVGIPVTVETLTRGRSVGKIAAGLRVVRDDGGPIRMRHALIRSLVGFVEIYLSAGSIALIASLANRRGKRLGDMLAGTYVVRERTARDLPPPVLMPPRLAGWAVGADIGRVPDRLALAVRQFLARAVRLHPASRYRLGTSLATQIAGYVAPPPPDGTHPEEFLAAVLAERRRRDLDRLQREAAARAARDARRREASPLSSIGTTLIGEERR